MVALLPLPTTSTTCVARTSGTDGHVGTDTFTAVRRGVGVGVGLAVTAAGDGRGATVRRGVGDGVGDEAGEAAGESVGDGVVTSARGALSSWQAASNRIKAQAATSCLTRQSCLTGVSAAR